MIVYKDLFTGNILCDRLFIWDYGREDGVYAKDIFCQYGVSDVLILSIRQ